MLMTINFLHIFEDMQVMLRKSDKYLKKEKHEIFKNIVHLAV